MKTDRIRSLRSMAARSAFVALLRRESTPASHRLLGRSVIIMIIIMIIIRRRRRRVIIVIVIVITIIITIMLMILIIIVAFWAVGNGQK